MQQEITNRQIWETLISFKKEVDERFEKIDEHFDKIDERFEKTDERFEKIDEHFEKIDERFEKIDERFQKIDERFQKIDERFEKIEARIERSEKSINSRLDRIERIQESDHKMLMDLWDHRNGIQIKFPKGYLIFNSFLAATVALTVSTFASVAIQ